MPGIPASPARPGETGTGRTWPRTRRPGSSPAEEAGQGRRRGAAPSPCGGGAASWPPRPGRPAAGARRRARPPARAPDGAGPAGTAQAAMTAVNQQACRLPRTAIPPTAPGTCAARSLTPGAGRWSRPRARSRPRSEGGLTIDAVRRRRARARHGDLPGRAGAPGSAAPGSPPSAPPLPRLPAAGPVQPPAGAGPRARPAPAR